MTPASSACCSPYVQYLHALCIPITVFFLSPFKAAEILFAGLNQKLNAFFFVGDNAIIHSASMNALLSGEVLQKTLSNTW